MEPDPPLTDFSRRIEDRIGRSGEEVDVGIAFRLLDGQASYFREADTVFHAASTMKVPVMIELFRQAKTGELSLEDPIEIRNEFKSIVDGTPYQLSLSDDSGEALYNAQGETRTLIELCEPMITVSSNFATNLLIDRLGARRVRQTVQELGASGMHVLRGVEDQKAFDQGLSNTTTARALLTIFEAIAKGQAVDPASDARMIDILKRQKFNEAIPAGVPEGIPVAHKTGQITRIHHDAGVVLGPKPYVLVLLVRGITDDTVSTQLMADLSRIFWEWSNN